MRGSIRRLYSELKGQFARLGLKGSFAQNVTIVFSGNVLVFGLQVLFTPVISRIYGPEAYGHYAYYHLIITNIAFFASLAFPSVYVIPRARTEYLALAKFNLISLLVLSALTCIGYLIVRKWMAMEEIGIFTMVIICLVLLIQNLNGTLSSWNVRAKAFGKNTVGTTAGVLGSKTATIGLGLWTSPVGLGLLAGDLVRAGMEFVIQTSWKVKVVVLRFMLAPNWGYVKSSVLKNKRVPRYIFSAQVINKLVADIPIWIIGLTYDEAHLGHYVFAVSMLSIPKNLVSLSIRPVFIQKLSDLYFKDKTLVGPFLERIILITFLLTFLPVALLFIWAPAIFEFVFGEEWLIAGQVASAIGFYYLVITIGESMSGIRRVIGQERRLFYLNLVSVIFRSYPLVLFWIPFDFISFVFFYAVLNSLFTVVNFGDLFFSLMTSQKAMRLTTFVLILVTLGALLSYTLGMGYLQ